MMAYAIDLSIMPKRGQINADPNELVPNNLKLFLDHNGAKPSNSNMAAPLSKSIDM